MAVIRDVMPAFELFQPASIADALALLDQHGADAWVLAGGLDSFDWLKDRIKKPKRGGRPEPGRRAARDQGARRRPRDRRDDDAHRGRAASRSSARSSSLLAEAAELVASPQIRNQGTLGGNVSQDTRCWYYRGGWTCYRAGGNICYADTPTAINREHAILRRRPLRGGEPVGHGAGADRARRADGDPQRRSGERVVDAEDYFIGPGIDITRHDGAASRANC